MRPGILLANSSPVSSGIGKASMSPRNRIVRPVCVPGFLPASETTSPEVDGPRAISTSRPCNPVEHRRGRQRQVEPQLRLGVNSSAQRDGRGQQLARLVEKTVQFGHDRLSADPDTAGSKGTSLRQNAAILRPPRLDLCRLAGLVVRRQLRSKTRKGRADVRRRAIRSRRGDDRSAARGHSSRPHDLRRGRPALYRPGAGV